MNLQWEFDEDRKEYDFLYKHKKILESRRELILLRSEVKNLQSWYGTKEQQDDNPKYTPPAEVGNMIEVGKVVSKKNVNGSKAENVEVFIGNSCLALRSNGSNDRLLYFSNDGAIELAQLLMKAAECQAEYAAAAKDLEEQKAKLDAKYKDMISGLGLENPDLQEKELPKQNWSGVIDQ